ncbi:MAG: SRPBCC family protein, partial [Thermoleophilaceae bacterium]
MHIHNVHTREIAAPAEAVGELLEGMGRSGGRLWPADRWPTAPMHFDRGLEVGSSGGHGTIRYVVEDHEPGRSVVFGFAPEMALDGIHRLDVESLGPRLTRLTHTLDARVEPRLRLAAPVLLGYHDAMVED